MRDVRARARNWLRVVVAGICGISDGRGDVAEHREGKIADASGRPSSTSKSHEAALGTEISDEMLWNLVKRSQLRPSEEPSFDHIDFFRVDGENRSPEDEAFIDGLIRFPSLSILNSEMSGRVDGLAMGIESPSPEESVEPMCKPGGSKQSFGDVQGFDLSLSRAPAQVLCRVQERRQGSQDDVEIENAARQDGYVWCTRVQEKEGQADRPSAEETVSFVGGERFLILPEFESKRRIETSRRVGSKRSARALPFEAQGALYGKTIHYEARKIRAAMRVRVGGRFAKSPAEDKREDFKGPVPA